MPQTGTDNSVMKRCKKFLKALQLVLEFLDTKTAPSPDRSFFLTRPAHFFFIKIWIGEAEKNWPSSPHVTSTVEMILLEISRRELIEPCTGSWDDGEEHDHGEGGRREGPSETCSWQSTCEGAYAQIHIVVENVVEIVVEIAVDMLGSVVAGNQVMWSNAAATKTTRRQTRWRPISFHSKPFH